MSTQEPLTRRSLLGDPRLRRELIAMVRRRVPADEVDDIVQATLTEALTAAAAPEALEELRRWVWGIARHKVADLHRRKKHLSDDDIPEAPAPNEEAGEARDLLRWAESELPEGENAQQTLGWLLREGEGEKLEHIAEAERLPAPRVRQRVTRLRQHFRARWQAQLAAVATLVGVAALIWWWRRPPEPVREAEIIRDPSVPSPSAADSVQQRADSVRRMALAQCQANDLSLCTIGLDEAKRLDPAGEQQPAVVEARAKVAAALRQVEERRAVASTSAALPQASSVPAPPTSGAPAITAPPSSAPSLPSASPSTTTTPMPKTKGDSLGMFGDSSGSTGRAGNSADYSGGKTRPAAGKQTAKPSPKPPGDWDSHK